MAADPQTHPPQGPLDAEHAGPTGAQDDRSLWTLFRVFLGLGLVGFGGPVAHLALFQRVLVERLGWLSGEELAARIALFQALPGPASSQVGMSIGLSRAGLAGLGVAWLGFTLPAALYMTAVALWWRTTPPPAGLLAGLLALAAVVVAQALWTMGQRLCPAAPQRLLALASAAVVVAWPGVPGLLSAVALGAAVGLLLPPAAPAASQGANGRTPHRVTPATVMSLVLLAVGLLVLPWLAGVSPVLELFEQMFRIGALVFGGGHVVLPLVQAEFGQIVDPLAIQTGYGAAQAMPGPLFAFGAYVGALALPGLPMLGAAVGLVGIFAPAMLLVLAAEPLRDWLKRGVRRQQALAGINAAVVGLLLSVLLTELLPRVLVDRMSLLLVLLLAGVVWVLRTPLWLSALVAVAAGLALPALGSVTGLLPAAPVLP